MRVYEEPSNSNRCASRARPRRFSAGFTLLEMIVLLAILGIIAGIAFVNLRNLENPVQNGASQLSGILKQSRAKAMSTTSAYQVAPESSGSRHLVARTAIRCSSPAADWALDPEITADIPTEVTLSVSGGTWPTCFDPRGFASANQQFTLSDAKGATLKVELLLGGAVRTVP